MKRRQGTMFAGLFAAIGTALLLPQAVFAGCQITDPGCYIDDFAHRQLYQFDLSIWQINRAGLVLARWLEDLRVWLTDSVFTDAFTTLTQPVKFAFYLALILAWLIFIISFMVQSFIDLRWVDLRRATRPILLAVFIFTFGGSLLKGTEQARLIGGTMLQQAASEAVQAAEAPQVPTENTGDMADASSSIYNSGTSCGTPARSQSAMFLNDYSARYLWSNADDVHCADVMALAGEFYNKYFPYGQNIGNQSDSDTRQKAVGWAAQGGIRQVTGVFMMTGAIIEQIVQLMFAVALALVWFGILISLVFAVFVPTEELFSSQIKALLSVLRASWLASFLIGLGLAVLQIVAKSGNGFLVLICGLVLIAVAIWQGKQALQTMSTALSAVSAASGSAPQAVGGMIKSWGMTAAMVAGVAATGGGLGAALTSVGSTMVRRAGRSVGDNPISEAAGRVLSNRVADRLDNYTQDQRIGQDASLNAAEAAWYERGEYADVGTPAADGDAKQQAEAAQQRAREQQARVLERQAERARQKRNFAKAAQLRREASKIRGGPAQRPDLDTTALEPDMDTAEMDLALEQLHEAQDDPEMQRRILAETAALAQRRAQLKAMRNLALREKRFDDAKAAIGELHDLPMEQAEEPAATGPAQPRRRRLSVVRGPTRMVKTLPPVLEPSREAVAAADVPAEVTNADDPNLVRFHPVSVPSNEVEAKYLPDTSESLQDIRMSYSPEHGMSVNGIPVVDMRYSEDGRRVTLRTATREITVANAWRGDLSKVHGRELKGRIVQRSDLASTPVTAMPGTNTPAAANQGIPATNDAPAVATTQAAATNDHAGTNERSDRDINANTSANARAATSGQQTTSVSSQGQRIQAAPRTARTSPTQEAQPGVTNGTASTVTPVSATAARSEESNEQSTVAPSAVAAAPVPTVVVPAAQAAPGALGTAPASVQPVPVGAPPVAAEPPTPTAAVTSAVAPVAMSMPVAEVVAPTNISAAAPVVAAAPGVPVVAPVEVPAAASAPGASMSTPSGSVTPVGAPATVQPAPRASNGLPLNGAASPVLAPSTVAPAAVVPIEERGPVQPTRATTDPVLPKVVEVRRRVDTADSHPKATPAVPVVTASPTKTATTPQQPWKRRKQGDE